MSVFVHVNIKGPGVCLNGLHNDLYQALMSDFILFYSFGL